MASHSGLPMSGPGGRQPGEDRATKKRPGKKDRDRAKRRKIAEGQDTHSDRRTAARPGESIPEGPAGSNEMPVAPGDHPSSTRRPRPYGYWMADQGDTRGKPMALIMFSGRSRAGDLQHQLSDRGWLVCALDLLSPTVTNILDESVWDQVLRDIEAGTYRAIWFGTPCNTFSPLRKKQPGPRPLRDKDHIKGLPAAVLRPAEKKQLKEANLLVSRTAQAARAQMALKLPWALENPTHGEDLSMWDMPEIKALLDYPDTEAVGLRPV